MTNIKWTWAILLALYAAFFSWYTSFKGPLTAEEIEHYMAQFAANAENGSPEMQARMRKFMEEDTGDDFVMLNAIHLYDVPQQIDGVAPGETSADVLNKYMDFMFPELLRRASHPVLYGSAAAGAMDLMNAEGMEQWTTGAAVRYRSRRDILDIATKGDFDGAHKFKIAAMTKTIAYPLDPWFHFGDPRLLLAFVFTIMGLGLSLLWNRNQ